MQPILNIRDVPGRHQVDNLAMAEGGPHAGVASEDLTFSPNDIPSGSQMRCRLELISYEGVISVAKIPIEVTFEINLRDDIWMMSGE